MKQNLRLDKSKQKSMASLISFLTQRTMKGVERTRLLKLNSRMRSGSWRSNWLLSERNGSQRSKNNRNYSTLSRIKCTDRRSNYLKGWKSIERTKWKSWRCLMKRGLRCIRWRTVPLKVKSNIWEMSLKHLNGEWTMSQHSESRMKMTWDLGSNRRFLLLVTRSKQKKRWVLREKERWLNNSRKDLRLSMRL